MAESEATQAKVKRRGGGKQKIEIKKVEKARNRYVTFSKRKAGLFKKAAELSTLTGADVGVIVFSQVGKAYSFGSPSVDAVTDRYLQCSSSPEEVSTAEECFERLKEEEEFWWEKSTEEMGLEELQSFRRSLDELRKRVSERAEAMGERESMLYLEYTDNGSDDQSLDAEIMRLLGECERKDSDSESTKLEIWSLY